MNDREAIIKRIMKIRKGYRKDRNKYLKKLGFKSANSSQKEQYYNMRETNQEKLLNSMSTSKLLKHLEMVVRIKVSEETRIGAIK